MDFQFFGANCITISNKSTRLVIDDNLTELGKKTIIKDDDVVISTTNNSTSPLAKARIFIDSPGEFEVSNISIVGIPARSHLDGPDVYAATMYKIMANDISILVTGHIYPKFNESQLESIGMIDVLIIPVGGNGYTLDAEGALTVIKEIEPKLIIPTHYQDKDLRYPVPQTSLQDALKVLAIEPKEKTVKLKLKASEISDITSLIVLETN